jgi:hypothetical protein
MCDALGVTVPRRPNEQTQRPRGGRDCLPRPEGLPPAVQLQRLVRRWTFRRLAALKHRGRVQAAKAEEDINEPDVAHHMLLVIREDIHAMRVVALVVLNGINLSDERHLDLTVWASRRLVTLFPIRNSAQFTTNAELSGVGGFPGGHLLKEHPVFAQLLCHNVRRTPVSPVAAAGETLNRQNRPTVTCPSSPASP